MMHLGQVIPPKNVLFRNGLVGISLFVLAGYGSAVSPQWNTLDITLAVPRTLVAVNGVNVTDYREGDPVGPRHFDFEPYPGRRPDAGYIGLQNHGDNDVVYFKEIAVKPLVSQ